MIPVDLMLTFILASSLLALAPGPDNIFVLTQAAVNGRKAGFFITLGLCTGLVFHTAAVALGIAAIFQQSALAFNVLKAVGALYLLYLAWQAFKAGSSEIDLRNARSMSISKLYRRGIVMNVTNPKVSIFFLAFLPQFASLDRGPLMPQIVILGLVFIVVALVIFSLIAMLAGFIGEFMTRSQKVQRIMNKIAGTVFVGLAVKLVFVER